MPTHCAVLAIKLGISSMRPVYISFVVQHAFADLDKTVVNDGFGS